MVRTPFLLLLLLPLTALSLPEPEGGLPVHEVTRVARAAMGGKCSTTADCVPNNVCSKWGWCQWTTIYGEDGPSQGSSAPGGGRAGQCVTRWGLNYFISDNLFVIGYFVVSSH